MFTFNTFKQIMTIFISIKDSRQNYHQAVLKNLNLKIALFKADFILEHDLFFKIKCLKMCNLIKQKLKFNLKNY